MNSVERLEEAKLMAVENILNQYLRDAVSSVRVAKELYDYAKEILAAIKDVEIAEELRQHEADLENASRNKPE